MAIAIEIFPRESNLGQTQLPAETNLKETTTRTTGCVGINYLEFVRSQRLQPDFKEEIKNIAERIFWTGGHTNHLSNWVEAENKWAIDSLNEGRFFQEYMEKFGNNLLTNSRLM